MIRLIPEWPLPSYIFIPGTNPHPKKTGGHMEAEGDPVSPEIDTKNPETNQHLRFAIDLFNYSYFWESHVYFESLWNAHQRKGPVADFLKALIKLGAAGVKETLDQPLFAREHRDRAIELLLSVRGEVGDEFLGFRLSDLITKIQKDDTIELMPAWGHL